MSDFWLLFIFAIICICIAYCLGYQMGFGKGIKHKYYEGIFETADRNWILKFKPDPYKNKYTLELTTNDWNRANNEYLLWCKRLQEDDDDDEKA